MSGGTLQVVQKLAPGGIETLALALAAALPGNNAIFSLEGEATALRTAWSSAAAAQIDIEAFGKRPGIHLSLVLELAGRLRELRPRALITHHIGPLLYAGAAARLAGVPRLAHVEHDIWHFDAPRRRALARFAIKALHPDYIVLSQAAAANQRRLLGVDQITIIPNGVDVARFLPGDAQAARHRFELDPERIWIGSAGRLETVKGHDVLIDAMALLPNRQVHLAIAGDGSQRQALQAQAIARGVADRVHFLGLCTDMPALLPAFDVFCLPSRAEGLPLSVLEAQAVGIPVVASDVGALREALCPGVSCLVPPADPGALAKGITEVLTRDTRASPRQFVVANFNWDQTVLAYRKLIGV